MVAFTEPACELLAPDELRAVAAHELGHFRITKPAIWALVRGRIAIALLAALPPTYGTFGGFGALFLFFAIVSTWMHARRVALHQEQSADDDAVAHSDATSYTRALERLHEANSIPAVLATSNASHPDLWDRMRAGGVVPAYPRPAPPRRSFAPVLLTLLLVPLVLGFIRHRATRAARKLPPVERVQTLGAVLGTRARDLPVLAYAVAPSEPESAILLARTAVELAPDRADFRADLARVFAMASRCDEALSLADARADRDPSDDTKWRAVGRICADPQEVAP